MCFTSTVYSTVETALLEAVSMITKSTTLNLRVSADDSRIMRDEGRKPSAPLILFFLSTFLSLSKFFSLSLTASSTSLGPYSLNGVPLRRVNQRYVIATSTTVSLAGVDVSKIDDALFTREKEDKKKKAAEGASEEKSMSPERKAAQDAVDAALGAAVKKTEMLGSYLQAKFSLGKYDRPHLLKF